MIRVVLGWLCCIFCLGWEVSCNLQPSQWGYAKKQLRWRVHGHVLDQCLASPNLACAFAGNGHFSSCNLCSALCVLDRENQRRLRHDGTCRLRRGHKHKPRIVACTGIFSTHDSCRHLHCHVCCSFWRYDCLDHHVDCVQQQKRDQSC